VKQRCMGGLHIHENFVSTDSVTLVIFVLAFFWKIGLNASGTHIEISIQGRVL
jgi:hypothetical protein